MQDTTTLIDYKGKIQNCLDKANCILNKYINDIPQYESKINIVNQLAKEKLFAESPIIMFYGIYNAGKSSIVNEILGEDVALVQDCPTTDKVTEYKFKNYRIFDTPGVGAPIQHEEITMSRLKESDIVIFVMSTTGSNEKEENYLRIKDIHNAGKKVIIVLNDKNGDLFNNDPQSIIGFNAIKQKVSDNIINVGLSSEDFIIVPVNAQRAKKGRQEDDPRKAELYIRNSNIQELIKIIIQEIKKTSKTQIWHNLVVELENIFRDCNELLLDFSSDKDVQKYTNEILNTIRDKKNKNREKIDNLVDRKYSRLPAQMQSYIWQNRDNPSGVDSYVNSLIQSTNQEIGVSVISELKTIYEDIQDQVNALKLKIQTTFENLDGKIANDNLVVNFAPLLNKMTEKLNIIRNFDFNDANANGSSNAVGTIVGGTIAYELATSQASKALLSSLGLTKFVPYVGPVIMAATVLFSIFGGSGNKKQSLENEAAEQNERENARLNAEKQAHGELIQRCNYLSQSMSDEVKINLIDGVNKAFKELVEPFKNLCSNADDKYNSIIADSEQLNQVIDELNEIKILLKYSD